MVLPLAVRKQVLSNAAKVLASKVSNAQPAKTYATCVEEMEARVDAAIRVADEMHSSLQGQQGKRGRAKRR
jgi:hypothetical protein